MSPWPLGGGEMGLQVLEEVEGGEGGGRVKLGQSVSDRAVIKTDNYTHQADQGC
jgi:hypothetical protein